MGCRLARGAFKSNQLLFTGDLGFNESTLALSEWQEIWRLLACASDFGKHPRNPTPYAHLLTAWISSGASASAIFAPLFCLALTTMVFCHRTLFLPASIAIR